MKNIFKRRESCQESWEKNNLNVQTRSKDFTLKYIFVTDKCMKCINNKNKAHDKGHKRNDKSYLN